MHKHPPSLFPCVLRLSQSRVGNVNPKRRGPVGISRLRSETLGPLVVMQRSATLSQGPLIEVGRDERRKTVERRGELVRTLMAFLGQTPIFKRRDEVGERDVSYVEPEQPAELYLAESLVLLFSVVSSLAAFGNRPFLSPVER